MTCKDVCVRQARRLHLHFWQISILKTAIRAVWALYELRELFKTNATSKEDMYFLKFPGEVVIMEDKCARIDFFFSLENLLFFPTLLYKYVNVKDHVFLPVSYSL